jgi:hypothetical protein
MEKKTGNLMSGLGGAAILALFLSPAGLSTSKSPPNSPDNKAPQVRVEESTKPLASDSPSGPWTAICEEYATDFDHGAKHLKLPTVRWLIRILLKQRMTPSSM